MQPRWLIGVALLAALPLISQTVFNQKTHSLLRFTLEEKPEAIARLLGRPNSVDDSARDYKSLQYETVDGEEHDENLPPAYILCLRAGDEQLLSVTRNFVTPQDVDDLFPQAETSVHHWPSTKAPQFSLRLRELPKGRLLLAMGTSHSGEPAAQLILIRRSALKIFMPWLAEQLP
jgi:hypothetical protein